MFLRSIFILLFLSSTLLSKAQIFMPSMRGAISSKPAIPTTMYSGGVGFGASQDQFIQNICSPASVVDIFYGGTGLGSQENVIKQTTCSDMQVVDIFYGGTGLGSQENVIKQTTCSDMQVVDIFYGGTGLGSQEKNLIQAACTPLAIESIFTGGIGYGNAFLFKDNCSFQVSSNLIRSYDINNRFSYNGSGTTLGDVSGNGVDGTLVNGVGYNSSNGGALVFDGNDDYVSFSSGLSSTDNLTNEAWVNPSAFSGLKIILIPDGWNTGNVCIEFDQNTLQFALFGEPDKYSNYTFNTNTWYQVATVYSKSAKTISFYVNGVLTNTENYSNPSSVSNSTLKMGSWNGNDRFFIGKIGLVRIYNSSLTSQEILTNFNGSKSRFGL
jgi:hypothetical protein